jgi:transglutaminase-like putative cysteine protease
MRSAFTLKSRPMSRDKADMLNLLTACMLVLLPHFLHLPIWVSLLVVALLGWRGWITFAGNRLPPRWVLLPVSAMAMGGIYLAFHTLFGRDAGVAMLALLLVLKLLEMHARRDLFVVLFLSFFLLLTNFFYSQSIPTALMMGAAVIALLTAQVSFQYTGAVPPFRKRLQLGAMIFGLAAPLMLVLFVLFPRIQGPLWGLPGDANGGRTGLSDSMTPGMISSLAQSDEIAFRVRFDDSAPAQSLLYWRATVLTHFDGRTWTQLPQTPMAPDSVRATPGSQPTHYQITLEPHGRRWLFALESPVTAPQIAGNAAWLANDLQLLASQRIDTRLRYDVTSWTHFQMQANEPPDDLAEALQLPPASNPATLQFARQLREQSTDPAELVRLVLQYFRQQPFSYTLEPPLLGRNSVDDFLFSTRAGFCEHYAAAFVVLMRDLGIAARVVTGYQGGEVNPIDGYMEIRQSDAHAWAEVWIAGRGWLRIDPTAAVAPERIQRSVAGSAQRRLFGGLVNLAPSRDSWLAQLRLSSDALSNSWNQWVLSYSPERQKKLIGSLGFGEVDWALLTALMFGASSIVMAVLMLPLLMNRPPVDRAEAMYRVFCRRMERIGIVRAAHEGPQALAARIAANTQMPTDKKDTARRFLASYEALQYGTVGPRERNAALAQLKLFLTAC